MKPIYPQIDIQLFTVRPTYGELISANREYTQCKFATEVRIQDKEGTWYTTPYFSSRQATTMEEVASSIYNFHAEVYRFIMTGEAVPTQRSNTGELVFTLDQDQRSEKERLKSIKA